MYKKCLCLNIMQTQTFHLLIIADNALLLRFGIGQEGQKYIFEVMITWFFIILFHPHAEFPHSLAVERIGFHNPHLTRLQSVKLESTISQMERGNWDAAALPSLAVCLFHPENPRQVRILSQNIFLPVAAKILKPFPPLVPDRNDQQSGDRVFTGKLDPAP